MMSGDILCYRCGNSLGYLTLPISRRDTCRACGAEVHVCRMCTRFSSDVAGQCLEEDAEDVQDKEKTNFCDWYEPAVDRFDPQTAGKAATAKSALDALFGDGPPDDAGQPPGQDAAEDLFK